MNRTQLRSFTHFQILTKIAYQIIAEIFKLINFQVCLHSLQNCESQSKISKSNVNMIYKCFVDEWNRNKKF